MEKFLIQGGIPLKGEVDISGGKNSSLPILCACILARGASTITNVPLLRDINVLLQLFGTLGISFSRNNKMIKIDASEINSQFASYDLVKQMRASILVLGPLIARFGFAEVSLPGGCAIGQRPVDIHLSCLEKMGCQINVANGYIKAKVKHLIGAELDLKRSVTATENLLMAATLADGETTLINPAPEPEVTELISFLHSMGALIKVENNSKIVVKGVKFLNPGKITVKPDRIEAATFLISGLATRGSVSIVGSDFNELDCVKKKLTLSGAKISGGNDFLKVEYCGKLIAVDIETGSYPSFPTDIQAQYMVLNAIAKGTSVMTENIFENRFLHVQELNRLGADIYTKGKKAFINGVQSLSGANVLATDLRASACLVIAGLVADFKTEVDRVYHIDRGYEKIEVKLTALGAKIFRTNV